MPDDANKIMEALKNAGIGGAFVRKDGTIAYATMKLEDISGNVLASLGNISEALLKRARDQQVELEIVADNDLVVLIPVKTHFLCGVLKNRDQKKTLREYADKLRTVV